ncbi:glycerophosphoryl diester phosphodiesterase [Colletotrichum plurivorum]|uniref:Glycerophosphoryl diester phosphodiesterase n=1 Tax=Colletotrichum plurivorum TaxID=2175906 RepID=A0A8H6JC78_9PEZI|nr:glycerophosphoryl diester phosphodiesterase [Colletotrichum plurivorum]
MQHTLNYPGNKGNIRSENIHERYLTLKQMFHSMPDDIPLLIEIKYPMLYEANDFKMDTFAPEVNHFLDTILAVIYSHAGPRRQIILASFSPDICMVLAVKQQTYPILFGSDASNYPTGDQRATSTQRAVRLARRFGLAGVLMASEPFVASPGLVGLVRSQGLYLATYGPLNDDANCAKIQAKAGVNMLIVDQVKHVRQALDEMESA